MGDINEDSAVFHFMDCLPSEICHSVSGGVSGTDLIFAVPGECHAADSVICQFFYAGDITGESCSALDGQKSGRLSCLPCSMHIGNGTAGGDAVMKFFHLAVKIVTVCFVVIDGGLSAVLIRDEDGIKLCPVNVRRDRVQGEYTVRIIKRVRGQPLMDTVCECVAVQIDQSIGIHGKFLLKIYFEFIVTEPFRCFRQFCLRISPFKIIG